MDFHKTASFVLPNIAAAQIESIASREFVVTNDCTTRNYLAFNVELKCLHTLAATEKLRVDIFLHMDCMKHILEFR